MPIRKADLLDPNRLRELLKPDPPKVISVPDDKIVVSKKETVLETLDFDGYPDSYRNNSNKEQLLLQYVEDFRRQFVATHPSLPPLLLYPRNEANTQKFISTFIRPVLLPYQELQNVQACAVFVSDFLEYLPLDTPLSFPNVIQSMTAMLRTRSGDCVDMSVFLCSLLRGAGYAAYVVLGKAPEWVTQCNLSNQTCPFLENNPVFDGNIDEWWNIDKLSMDTKNEITQQGKAFDVDSIGAFGSVMEHYSRDSSHRPATSAPIPVNADILAQYDQTAIDGSILQDDSTLPEVLISNQQGLNLVENNTPEEPLKPKYQIEPLPVLQSKFVEKLEWERGMLEQLRQRDVVAEQARKEKKVKDLWEADRVHAWVMVGPGTGKSVKNSVKSPIFIEPATGVLYLPQKSPYMTISAVFDDKQYWACVKEHQQVGELSLDLNDRHYWEQVLPNAPIAGEDNNGLSEMTNIVRMPPAWIARPMISRDEYKERFPTGKRITYFKNCVCERYQDHEASSQGLTLQLTLFADKSASQPEQQLPLVDSDDMDDEPIEVRCYYRHRDDLLLRRDTFPNDERIHEFYATGREGGVREIIQITTKQRIVLFDPSSRIDRLACRMELAGVKVVEIYQDRLDRLVYRSIVAELNIGSNPKQSARNVRPVTMSLGRGNEQPIKKVIERFSRNPSVPACKDVEKRSYQQSKNLIVTEYHREKYALRNDVEIVDKDERLHGTGSSLGLQKSNMTVSGGHQSNGNTGTLSGAGRKIAMMDSSTANKQTRGYEVRVSPDYVAPTAGQRKDALQALLLRERTILALLREHEKNMGELLQRAEIAKHDTNLLKHVYDIAAERVKNNTHVLAKKKTNEEAEKKEEDFLAPFLLGVAPNKKLSKQEAIQVKDRCLGALKERLVERANVIQAHLDAENLKLQHAQVQFKRNAGNGSEKDEELNLLYEQTLFKIEIIKTRQKLHEESAVAKYIALERKLNSHPKLSALCE